MRASLQWTRVSARFGDTTKRGAVRCVCRGAWIIAVVVGLACVFEPGRADEGMWLFNDPPLSQLGKRYGFVPSADWLLHLQRSAVRFNNGGSGSFVSAQGLIITNHHVALRELQRFTNEMSDYVRDGFLARSYVEEKPCKGLEVDVLISIEDVTPRFELASKSVANSTEALAARRAVRNEIEKESEARTGLRSEVVPMYQGSRYALMSYRRYTDIRLVFAPEQQVAFFGGNADNFEFPRYALDVCFFRAYEDGRPAKVDHWLECSRKGASAGDLVFVAGQPGATHRYLTKADLEEERDLRTPLILEWAGQMEKSLQEYGGRSEDCRSRIRDLVFTIQNTRKRYEVEHASLQNPMLFSRKLEEEAEMMEFSRTHAEFGEARGAWIEIETARDRAAGASLRNELLGRLAERSSYLFSLGRGLYRHSFEIEKPNGQRLYPYRDSNRSSLEAVLFADRPVVLDLEQAELEAYLAFVERRLGVADPLVKKMLNGKTPGERAREAIEGTDLHDPATRKRLYAMDSAAMEDACEHDTLLSLVAAVDRAARDAQQAVELANEVKAQAYSRIARVRNAVHGTKPYPDANFTLRLSFGSVKGYDEDGVEVAPFTKIGDMFSRAAGTGGNPEYVLSDRWLAKKGAIHLETPLNFASTCDVIGGSSGSPVVDRKEELVGVVFDGNRDCAGADYAYSDVRARAVAVDVRGVIEVLGSVYGASELVGELREKTPARPVM